MKFKKTVSLLTALSVLIGSCCLFRAAFADDAAGICTVADFTGENLSERIPMSYKFNEGGQEITVAKTTSAVKQEDFGFGDSAHCMSMPLDKNILYYIPDPSTDWTKYSTVNIRLKSDTDSQTFNCIFSGTLLYAGGKNVAKKLTVGTEWTTVSFKTSELANAFKFSDDQKHISMMQICASGWGNTAYTEGAQIYFDKIWLEAAGVGTELEAPSANVENNSTFVPRDIDGTNTIRLTFKKELYGGNDYSSAISFYKIFSDSEKPYDKDYTVNADGCGLKIEFAEELDDISSYKLVINPNTIYAFDGSLMKEKYELVFSVGKGPAYFNVDSVSVPDGESVKASDDFKYTITFNSELDTDTDYSRFVSVYSGNYKILSGIEYTAGGKSLTLSMGEVIKPAGKYSVLISADLTDAYGTKITKSETFGFTTLGADEENSFVSLYSASGGLPLSGMKMTDENAHFYPSSSKGEYTAGKSTTFVVKENEVINLAGLNYLNLWVYSPNASGNIMNMSVRSTVTEGLNFNLDFEGWKLITVPLEKNCPQAFKAGYTDRITVNFGAWDNPIREDGYILTDDIWLSDTAESELSVSSVSIPDGSDNVDIINTTLVYTLSSELLSDTPYVFSIHDESGTEFTDYTCSASGNNFTVFLGELKPDTVYTASIDGLRSKLPLEMKRYESSFKTSASSYGVSNISFENDVKFESGKDITAKFGLYSNISSDVELKLSVNTYGDGGTMISNAEKDIVLSAGESVSKDCTITPDKSASYIKAYVKNKNGVLLSDCYAVLGINGYEFCLPENVLGGETGNITAAKSEVNGNTIFVSGNIYRLKNNIMITLKSSDGALLSEEPISASADNGYFEYSYLISDSGKSDIMTLNASVGNANASEKIYYICQSDKDKLLDLSLSNDGLYEFLKQNSELFKIDGYSDDVIKDMANILYENKPYSDFDSAYSVIANVGKIYDGINNCIWSMLADYIEANHKYLLNDGKYYTDYSKYSDENKNIICRSLADKIPFKSVSDFRSAFDTAVKEKSGGGKSGNVSGGGGGGSVSGGGKKVADIPYVPIASPDNSDDRYFNDLIGFDWAKDDINSLCEKGVISKSDDKKFRPQDSITREEFVKLLISALYGDIYSAGVSFTDAEPSAWYMSYISKAYSEGIVTGKTDGSFGIGENITREDMAVMAMRALEKSGKELSQSGNASFYDSEDISDYAKSSVNAFAQNGIINGMGDGSFMPKGFATRAQAAKIISRIMTYV